MYKTRLLRWVIPLVVISLLAACGDEDSRSDNTTAPQPSGDLIQQGEQVYFRDGIVCQNCHKSNVDATGPALNGLYGRRVELEDGSTVIADEAYLRESILDPNAKIVAGFSPYIMPNNYATRLTPPELDALIAYIISLQ